MRIAISGSQCLGKTTLVNDLLRVIPDHTTTVLTYRDTIKKHKLNLNKTADVKGQSMILNSLIEDVLLNDSPNIVFDRCVFDAYVYSEWSFYNNPSTDIDETFLQIQIELCKFYSHHYDKIIFIPLNGDGTDPLIVKDGLREVDESYRVEIDIGFNRMYSMLIDSNPEITDKIITVSGSQSERIEKLMNVL